MHNWSVDIKKLSKYLEKYKIWKLEQLINFGLDGQKLKTQDLKKYFNQLNIDPMYKRYLRFLLS